MSTLLLRLSAPLQSWGTRSKFDTRETDYYPSKCGVIGMLAAALGYDRNTPKDKIEKLSGLKFGIRIDDGGKVIDDYHTTEMVKNYDGSKVPSKQAFYKDRNVSHRKYLSDAIFLVGFESDDEAFLEKLDEALRNPKFSIFLGRRSCPPSFPVALGIKQDSLYKNLYETDWLVPEWRQKKILRGKNPELLRIITDDENTSAIVRDVPVSFSLEKREYRYRYVREQNSRIIYPKQSVEHDPMQELG